MPWIHHLSLNLAIALQMLLTVLMFVATTEATFSKLKIIKNYLRNTMTQRRSCSYDINSAMILTEKELVNSFNYVILKS
ncbi:hypothetical protein ALC57_05140 [Trachymyrmex cornetzi]|uniref:HAT C-terminal dimerisation domain-containing protein n=1 Tax=Trachymyrmex cornetzi TaxID=471704 RepID=A0A151JBD5_9HYME|nr:hypothetical protein ALC57_05140 [Trachymyrmex cornetzi]